MLKQHNDDLEKQQSKLNAHQGEIEKIVDDMKKAIGVLKKFNEKVKEDQLTLEQKKREEVLEERKEKFVKDMSDDEFDDMLQLDQSLV